MRYHIVCTVGKKFGYVGFDYDHQAGVNTPYLTGEITLAYRMKTPQAANDLALDLALGDYEVIERDWKIVTDCPARHVISSF